MSVRVAFLLRRPLILIRQSTLRIAEGCADELRNDNLTGFAEAYAKRYAAANLEE